MRFEDFRKVRGEALCRQDPQLLAIYPVALVRGRQPF